MNGQRATRRRVLLTLGAGMSAGVAGCASDSSDDPTPTDTTTPAATATPTTATETPTATAPTTTPALPDLGGYLDDVPNFDGTVVDERGTTQVTVDVGVGRVGYAFGPPAVRVDTGTTVSWVWTGEGGDHNVVGEDNPLDSGDTVGTAGTTYEYRFEAPGLYKYYCAPHIRMGMKGVVVVG